MSEKFRELAKAIKGDLQNLNSQADELMARRERLRRRGEEVFGKHRENLAGVERALAVQQRDAQ